MQEGLNKVLLCLFTSVAVSWAQGVPGPILLKRGMLWETVNIAKMGPLFYGWNRIGYGMDFPGFDPEYFPAEQIGGANSLHAGGGFWISAIRPSTAPIDSVWGVEDWAMYAGSVGASQTQSRYLIVRHQLRYPNGENYWFQTDPVGGEEVVETEWKFNPNYQFQYLPARFLPVDVKRTVRTWSGSARDERYIIVEYVIRNISRDPDIYNPVDTANPAQKILARDSVLSNTYIAFTYAFSINARGWNMLFSQYGSGAMNNRFLYDPVRRMVYGWADDFTQSVGNDKFDPFQYQSGGPPGGREWLAPQFAGIKFLHISKDNTGQTNRISSVAWSVSDPRDSYPYLGLNSGELIHAAMADPAKMYKPILFPQGLSDPRWGNARMWTVVNLGPFTLMPGDSITVVMAEVVGMAPDSLVTNPTTTQTQIAQLGLQDLQRNADRAQFTYDHGYRTIAAPPSPGSFVLEHLPGTSVGNVISWSDSVESLKNPDYGISTLVGYRIYRSGYLPTGPYQLIATIPKGDPKYYNSSQRSYTYIDSAKTGATPITPGYGYYYSIVGYDTGHANWPIDVTARFPETGSNRVPPLESSKWPNHTIVPFIASFAPVNSTLDSVLVVPNPFIMRSGFVIPGEQDYIQFVNVPSPCTIRIYTLRGDLVKTIEHTEATGVARWDQITDYGQFAKSGIYIFHLTSYAPATNGMVKIGKFAIVR